MGAYLREGVILDNSYPYPRDAARDGAILRRRATVLAHQRKCRLVYGLYYLCFGLRKHDLAVGNTGFI